MSQEDIDATKAPLMDHLIELRARIIRSLYAFVAAFIVCFYFSRTIYNVLTYPYVRVVGADKATLIATHFLEQFYTNIRLSMFGAAVIAFPVIAVQIYKFIAPGLYRNERQAFRPYLIATPIFFLFGALLVYFVVMPLLIRFSVSLQQVNVPGEATIELLPKVGEYLSLIMTLSASPSNSRLYLRFLAMSASSTPPISCGCGAMRSSRWLDWRRFSRRPTSSA
jgi:sec-independent protein translocase protein TatC